MPERAHLWTVPGLPLTVDSLWTPSCEGRFACPQPDHRSLGQRFALTHSPLDNPSLCYGLTTLTTGIRLLLGKKEEENTGRSAPKKQNRTFHMSMEPVMLTCYQHPLQETCRPKGNEADIKCHLWPKN